MRIALACLLFCSLSLAAETLPQALPEPLDLQQALRLASEGDHPALLQAQARLAAGSAALDLAERENDPQAALVAGLRLIEPSPVATDQDSNDSYLKLNLSKRLYDFGRQQAGEAVAEASLASVELHLLAARQQRQLEVMQRFFGVLLADLRHARDNEAMAVAYIGFDKARSRVQTQQMSELELLRREQDYQLSRQQLASSDNARRAARSALALALNRPGQLPASLRPGKLGALQRRIPALDGLI
ncbi:MAG: TolC family protein, partial [Gammaproteobacteria bacterium]|nr:TolC family protein [Gammaproteobacteria bacterium]